MRNSPVMWGLVLSLLMMGQIVRAEEPQNLLENPGFEKVAPFLINNPKYKDALPGVDEMPEGWMIDYSAFPGMLTVVYDAITSHGGSKYIRLKERGAKPVALLYEKRVSVEPGKKYSFSVWAKGEGQIQMFIYTFARKRRSKYLGGIPSQWMEVSSEEWKEYKFEFTLTHEDVGTITPRFQIKGTVDLDDASLFLLQD